MILFIGVICVASASADSNQDTQSKGTISEFNDSNSQSDLLPDFSPLTFQNLKNDPNVLATKGQIPQYATQAERQNWLDKLDITYKLTGDEMSPYAYPKGPLLAHGFNFDGYIEVVFYKGMNVSDSQINEIYNVINKKVNEASVQDVLVVFKKSDFFQDAIATEDVGTANETSNLSVSEEKNVKIFNNSSTNNSDSADNIPQRLPLTFGPETLDKLKSDPNFIAAYGSIPSFSALEERKQWLDKLNNVYQGAISEISKYEYPNGPVTSFGYTIDGVIQVGINRSRTVDKPFMDEIYQILDSNANRMEIKEIPVVFVHEDNPVPTVKIDPIIKTANSSVYGEKNSVELNNNSSGNKSSKNNSIPDIGVLGSLICLCSGWRLRKM